MVTQKKVPDKLLDPTSITHMFDITKNVGMLVTGLMPDAKSLVHKVSGLILSHNIYAAHVDNMGL